MLDGFDHCSDLEWFFEEGVESCCSESLGLAVGEFAGHGDEFGHLHGFG